MSKTCIKWPRGGFEPYGICVIWCTRWAKQSSPFHFYRSPSAPFFWTIGSTFVTCFSFTEAQLPFVRAQYFLYGVTHHTVTHFKEKNEPVWAVREAFNVVCLLKQKWIKEVKRYLTVRSETKNPLLLDKTKLFFFKNIIADLMNNLNHWSPLLKSPQLYWPSVLEQINRTALSKLAQRPGGQKGYVHRLVKLRFTFDWQW